jgi:hypothetical protein
MNSTVDIGLSLEETAKREYELAFDPFKVRVRVRVSWSNGICLPDSKGSSEEEAVFKVLTFGDNHILDKVTCCERTIEGGHGKVMVYDLNEYRRLMVKRSLLSWTLDIPIERQGGWMTPECYRRVSRVPAPLMEAFLDEFESRSVITKEEEEKIVRQSLVLFGRNSRGVADACEAVSAFCTLGNFWEKFGVGKGVPIHEMPYREYLMLKIVIGKENEASRVNSAPKRPLSRIASAGGRVRASRGVVMDD